MVVDTDVNMHTHFEAPNSKTWRWLKKLQPGPKQSGEVGLFLRDYGGVLEIGSSS